MGRNTAKTDDYEFSESDGGQVVCKDKSTGNTLFCCWNDNGWKGIALAAHQSGLYKGHKAGMEDKVREMRKVLNL